MTMNFGIKKLLDIASLCLITQPLSRNDNMCTVKSSEHEMETKLAKFPEHSLRVSVDYALVFFCPQCIKLSK